MNIIFKILINIGILRNKFTYMYMYYVDGISFFKVKCFCLHIMYCIKYILIARLKFYKLYMSRQFVTDLDEDDDGSDIHR